MASPAAAAPVEGGPFRLVAGGFDPTEVRAFVTEIQQAVAPRPVRDLAAAGAAEGATRAAAIVAAARREALDACRAAEQEVAVARRGLDLVHALGARRDGGAGALVDAARARAVEQVALAHDARDRRARLVAAGEHEVVVAAEQEARAIVEDARNRAAAIVAGARADRDAVVDVARQEAAATRRAVRAEAEATRDRVEDHVVVQRREAEAHRDATAAARTEGAARAARLRAAARVAAQERAAELLAEAAYELALLEREVVARRVELRRLADGARVLIGGDRRVVRRNRGDTGGPGAAR